MENPKMHVGGLLVFSPPDGKRINDMYVLLVRKIDDHKRFHKYVGTTLDKCVDSRGDRYIDDKQKFLHYLRNNLETRYNFTSAAAQRIMYIEEAHERGNSEYALIISFLSKAELYPMSFTRVTRIRSGIERKMYFVGEVLTSQNQIVSDPRLLNKIVDSDDGFKRELVPLSVKEACEKLYQVRNVYAVPFISLKYIIAFALERSNDSDSAKTMIREYEFYSRSLIGS